MAKHDIVTYNSTTKGFETDLGDNTAQIKGDGNKILSVESGSDTLFSVGTSNTSVVFNSHITSSGNISSSLSSTASFGRLEFTKISGDASQMTNVNELGHVSGAAQLATRISGAFDSGFTALGHISGSRTSSGSFGRVFAAKYVGDASQMTNVNESGHISSSAQLATRISQSFNKGFEFTGTISGSATSTGSFGRTKWDGQITGDASQVTNLNESGFISSSKQIAAQISGAFTSGFEFTGIISGSSTSTGSFGRVDFTGDDISGDASQATNVPVDTNTVSGSAQLASQISGAFNTGFQYGGTISGSMASTASFHVISASTYVITNVPDINTPLQQIEGAVSASSQLVNDVGNSYISGAFTSGFEFSGQISGSANSTGSFTRLDALELVGDGSRIGGITVPSGLVSSSAQLADQISGSFNKGFRTSGLISGSVTSTGSFAKVTAKKYIGDFSAVDAPEQGYISSSAQLATRISGSFNKGFTFGINTQEVLDATFVGVSGSTFASAANSTTMSISSICGSDFDYRLADGIGAIKGTSYGMGSWSAGPDMITAVNGRGMAGTQNAFLSMGAYSDPNKTKTEKFNGSSWSVSANLNTGGRATAGVGTQNAAGLFGGYDHSYNGTEFYFGAAWSEGPNTITTAAWKGSAGTVNAALLYGGNGPSNAKRANTELYNGNVFTETADLSTARGLASAGGTQNDAIYASGLGPSSGVGNTEIWNGTSWTEVANVIKARWNSTGIGTANHHIVVAGQGPAQVACVEEWNGDSWSEVNGLITARSYAGPAAGGLGSQGIYAGGDYSPSSAKTEFWNAGSSTTGSFGLLSADNWTVGDVSGVSYSFPNSSCTLANLATRISGSFNKGFEFNGKISGSVTSTGSLSIFESDIIVAKDMTIGSFTDTNQMPYQSSSFRSHTNKPHIIPYVGDAYYDSKKYMPTGSQFFSCGSCTEFSNGYNSADGQLSIGTDGILNISFQTSSLNQAVIPGAWSSGPDTITIAMASAVGTQNSSLFISGKDLNGGNTPTRHTQHYNGISWRLGGDTIEDKGAQVQGQAFGIQNSAQAGPSRGSGNRTKEMQYNGVSWYIVQSMQTDRCMTGAAGTTDAGLRFGKGDSPYSGITEEWNGHSWSEVNAMGDARAGALGGGTQNAGITGGGFQSPTATELYDGNTWSEAAAHTVSAADRDGASGGTQNNFSINLNLDKSETFDGVTWSVNPTLTIDRYQPGFAGQGSLGMVMGGSNASGNSATKDTLEWNGSFASGSFLQTKKIGSNFS